jgi:hypothetical protein
VRHLWDRRVKNDSMLLRAYVVPRRCGSYSPAGTEGCLGRQSVLVFVANFFGSL